MMPPKRVFKLMMMRGRYQPLVIRVHSNPMHTIAAQKQRAIDFWETSKAEWQEDLKDQVHNDVMKHLLEGKVLPIFHALCRPPKQRLFPPKRHVSVEDDNSDIIQLSAAPVTMGECNFRSEKKSVSKISSRPEASYIPAFFQLSAAPVTTGECISKKGNETLSEISMEGEESYIPAFFKEDLGIFEVKDCSNFSWKYDDDSTKIITDLVNAPADMVGEDIEVTKLLEPLDVDWEGGHNLITRRLSRGVVADCFDMSEHGSTYAIVGNVGIGKSWTLIYALQQALLYENACVLLCFQKEGTALVCIRRNDKIYVWMNDDLLWKNHCHSKLLQNSNVLVLLDPRESKMGGAAYSEGQRMLIMAASNNAKHLGGIRKFTPDYARYLSPFTDNELRVAAPLMGESQELPVVDADEALMRAKEVGRVPLYIISDVIFQYRKKEICASINTLKKTDAKVILSFDGSAEKNYESLHGCIFAVEVSLERGDNNEGNYYSNEHYVSETQLDDDYETNETEDIDDDNDTAIESVGYDGQYVPDYGRIAFGIISESVYGQIVKLSREYILSLWGVTSNGRRSEMGRIVKDLFWQDLKDGLKMRVFSMKEKNASRQGSLLDIGKCKVMDETVEMNELGQKVFDNKRDGGVIARMDKNVALCDFAGPCRTVFQVTVSDRHTISMQGLAEMLISSGHLQHVGETKTIVKSENADHIEKLSLYWVVPPGRIDYWKSKRPGTILKCTSELLKKCLDEYVKQYVLVIDIVRNHD